jgi:DNA-binding transcriptional MerR regulator
MIASSIFFHCYRTPLCHIVLQIMRKYPFITTSKAAKQIGVHPNTLRWYEEKGFLPTIPRTNSGYRKFTQRLVIHASIVYLALRVAWMKGPIRNMTYDIISFSRTNSYDRTIEICDTLIHLIEKEMKMAKEALSIIDNWMKPSHGVYAEQNVTMSVKKAASFANISSDQIRNWERNGLIILHRQPSSGYRVFGNVDLNRLKVIRLCRQAGYSLTAIRRLMRSVYESEARHSLDFEKIIDTPNPDEVALYPTFPTDKLLSTQGKGLQNIRHIKKLLSALE